jgi:MtN3 and saliva related transmembrane protein
MHPFSFWIGLIAGICTSISLLPQLFKIIKEKRSENISLPYLVILLAGLCLWILYGVMKKDMPVIFTNVFAVLTALTTLVLGIVYRMR